MTTDVVSWTAAVAMVGVATFHSARLARCARRRGCSTLQDDLTHVAMGIAMAIMFVRGVDGSVGRRLALAFTVPLLWFGWRTVRCYVMDGRHAMGAPARLAVGSAAMVYVFTVGSTGAVGAMPGMSMSATDPTVSVAASPAIVGLLIAATVAVAVLALARPRSVGLPASPSLSTGCQLAMSAATVVMLVAS